MTAPAVDYESKKKKRDFDPDSYRMTIGEHLEELRWRMILGLGAFFVCAFIFLIPQVAEHVGVGLREHELGDRRAVVLEVEAGARPCAA